MANTYIGNVLVDGNMHAMHKICSAIPSNAYEFVKWQGDEFLTLQLNNKNASDNPIDIILNDYSVTDVVHNISACFQYKTQYTLSTVFDANGGNVTGGCSSYDSNVFTITAIPYNDYYFKEWEGDIISYSLKTNATITVSLPKTDPFQCVKAIFERIGQQTLFEYVDGSIEYKKIIGAFTYKDIDYRLTYNIENHSIKKITFGLLVTKIDEYACANCVNLEEIQFTHRDCTVELSPYAFYNATKLSSFDFSYVSSTNIPSHAFDSCYALRTLIFSDKKNIDEYAFKNCSSLEEFDFSNVLSFIQRGAFKNSGIKTIQNLLISDSILNDECFMDCHNLTCVIIPSNINHISFNCFNGCENLKLIDLTQYKNTIPIIEYNTFMPVSDVPNRVFQFDSINESSLIYGNENWKLLYQQVNPYCINNTELIFNILTNNTQIQILLSSKNTALSINWDDGSDVEELSFSSNSIKYQFISHRYKNCKNTEKHVIISGDHSSIKCTSQYLISLPALSYTITSLQNDAFKNTKLTQLQLPATIQNIGSNILYNTPITIDAITIINGSIIPDIWGILGNGRLVQLLSNQSTITRFDATSTDLITLSKHCFSASHQLQEILLPNTIQNIEIPIISKHGLPNLTSLSIESDGQFFVINNMLISQTGDIILTTNNPDQIPNIAHTICSYAFTNTQLISLTIPSTITKINNHAFCNNMQLNDIYVPFSRENTERLLSLNTWFYGGIDYQFINNDNKQQTRELNIICSDGSLQYVLTTASNGYLKQPLVPSKVKLLTVSIDYKGNPSSSLSELTGMTNDSDRLIELLDGFVGTCEKITNRDATLANVTDALEKYVNNSADDELFIFHFSGHGGQSSGSSTYMCLWDKHFNDSTFWNILHGITLNSTNPTPIKGRVVAIFCCCHAGTMFQSAALTNNLSLTRSLYPNWTKSAINYFTNKNYNSLLNATLLTDDEIEDEIEDEIDMVDEETINFISDADINMIVYSACTDDELSWMREPGDPYNDWQPNSPSGSHGRGVGHAMMTSLINNFVNSNKLYTYYDLFVNATTPNEESTKAEVFDNKLYQFTPQMTIIGEFDENVRAFT